MQGNGRNAQNFVLIKNGVSIDARFAIAILWWIPRICLWLLWYRRDCMVIYIYIITIIYFQLYYQYASILSYLISIQVDYPIWSVYSISCFLIAIVYIYNQYTVYPYDPACELFLPWIYQVFMELGRRHLELRWPKSHRFGSAGVLWFVYGKYNNIYISNIICWMIWFIYIHI